MWTLETHCLLSVPKIVDIDQYLLKLFENMTGVRFFESLCRLLVLLRWAWANSCRWCWLLAFLFISFVLVLFDTVYASQQLFVALAFFIEVQVYCCDQHGWQCFSFELCFSVIPHIIHQGKDTLSGCLVPSNANANWTNCNTASYSISWDQKCSKTSNHLWAVSVPDCYHCSITWEVT